MNIKNLFKLVRNLKIKSFEKGEILIKEGDNQKDIFFIRKGLVRCFLVNENGEEVTFQMFAENQAFGNVSAILFNEPSKYFFETFEKTKVYTADISSLQQIADTQTDLFGINNRSIGRVIFKRAFQRLDSFVLLSPEERYIQYVKENKNIIHRVPDKYIANVLGITPVSLSRIRGRIATKKK